jgi:hypothetical protein
MPKRSKLDVLVEEPSALKRKVAIETFRKNGYRKLPQRGHYTDKNDCWVMLKKGKTEIKITWTESQAFDKKRVARKRK